MGETTGDQRTLVRLHSVRERICDSLAVHTNELVAVFSRLVNQGKGMLQPHQITAEYDAAIPEAEREKLKDSAFEDLLRGAQEAIVIPPWVALAIRPRPGVWEYVRVNVSELGVEELTVPEYLQFKELLVNGRTDNNFVLELDFGPFNASFPRPSLSKSIGNGVQFLNRHLSSKLFHDKESMSPLLNFLREHKCAASTRGGRKDKPTNKRGRPTASQPAQRSAQRRDAVSMPSAFNFRPPMRRPVLTPPCRSNLG